MFSLELIPVFWQSAHNDFFITPVVGSHYFLPGLQVPSQPYSIATLWSVLLNDTAWWHKYTVAWGVIHTVHICILKIQTKGARIGVTFKKLNKLMRSMGLALMLMHIHTPQIYLLTLNVCQEISILSNWKLLMTNWCNLVRTCIIVPLNFGDIWPWPLTRELIY